MKDRNYHYYLVDYNASAANKFYMGTLSDQFFPRFFLTFSICGVVPFKFE